MYAQFYTTFSGLDSHLSLVHFMVGVGSPTELQGSRTSFIQGVVTVPPNDRILAGAGGGKKMHVKIIVV